VAQRLDDRAAPPARAPEPSIPQGDRPTPIVDISREVATAVSDTRATARLRVSQLTNLIDLTRDEAAAKKAIRASLAEAAPPPISPPISPPVERRRSVAVPVTLGLAALTIAAVIGYSKIRPAPAPHLETATVVAPVVAAASTAATPAKPELAARATTAEIQARATLERLRTGLDTCIRNGIHALPGGSPAVPPGLAALKDGAFTPAPGDWKTAVWSCAQFQMTDPMEFQLQWQLVKPNAEGRGVAWIDQDRDGVADRALGFSITLGPRGEPILGDIQGIEATTPVSTLRR
jgi:hypothetical protein